MDKKQMFVFLLLFAIALFSVVAIAEETEEETEVEDTTQQDMTEAEIMHIGHGATVRLLQLEKSITKNFLYGEHVLTVISEKSYDIDTTRLEEIIRELNDAKEQLSTMIEGIEDTTPEEAVEEFVGLKSKAINLTHEFKTILRTNLTVEQRQEIKELVEKKDFSEIENINEEILQAMKNFNKNRTIALLSLLGLEDEDLVEKIENEEITTAELRRLIVEKFKSLTREEKKDFLNSIKEERIRVQLLRHDALGKKLGLGKQEMEKVRNILNNNDTTFAEKKAKLGAYAQEKIRERMEEVKETIQNRIKENKSNQNGSDEE